MQLTRTEARALAVTTLEALGTFEAVLRSPPALFGGISPIAIVTSKALTVGQDTHELIGVISDVTVSIYVRSENGAADAAEDLLDSLALSSALALYATEGFDLAKSSAGPEDSGLRDPDRNGVLYRVERIVCSAGKRYDPLGE